jgi:hypothetical protein
MFSQKTKLVTPIDLHTPLSLNSSFRFPLQSAVVRRGGLIGGLLLLVPVLGWLLNMGHRIQMVHNMMHGRGAWPAWVNYPGLFRHGLVTFAGMAYYYLSATACGFVFYNGGAWGFLVAAIVLFVLATLAIPGYMTHYCREFELREIFNPFRALSRVLQGGRGYWRAWGIALAALACSFLGLLGLGVGFLFSSVWFWQVAGFSFASTMTQRHGLMDS